MNRVNSMGTALLVLGCLASAHAWGGLFNRFSSDMLANLGYGRGPYRHFPYGQVEPEEVYAEALEGNRIDDVIDEPAHCYSSPCATNGDCCRGLLCLDTDEPAHCYSSPCATNWDCCRGLLCLDTGSAHSSPQLHHCYRASCATNRNCCCGLLCSDTGSAHSSPQLHHCYRASCATNRNCCCGLLCSDTAHSRPQLHPCYSASCATNRDYCRGLLCLDTGNSFIIIIIIDDVIDEPAHCYSSPCATNGDCCRGLLCLDTEDGGRCLPAFSGRKFGEMCNRDNQCDAGLVCEEVVPGEMHVCRAPSPGRKQYNEDCGSSSECDVTRGLCCIMQRRHRQKPRKSCGYFKEPLVCIGPVALDQVREAPQHTAGEKRVGLFRLH
ncbi:hypothetical protein ABMA28_011089 [Loxostege sticticalis]|uniref:Uncharacterized protein n=1 Tax=Loxostege sticticalis TaxID=481309 RepID=A0ABD0S7A7_LOXSC